MLDGGRPQSLAMMLHGMAMHGGRFGCGGAEARGALGWNELLQAPVESGFVSRKVSAGVDRSWAMVDLSASS